MRLTHPGSKQSIDVADGSEGPYLRNGWVAKPAKAKKADTDPGDRAAGDTSDPSPERG